MSQATIFFMNLSAQDTAVQVSGELKEPSNHFIKNLKRSPLDEQRSFGGLIRN